MILRSVAHLWIPAFAGMTVHGATLPKSSAQPAPEWQFNERRFLNRHPGAGRDPVLSTGRRNRQG